MAHHVCPWWLGYVLAMPLRRLWQDPVKIVGPFVGEGMTVLEPGPGMGFFTIELARRVGPRGKVVAVDVQSRMLGALRRRAKRAGVADRIDTRLVEDEHLGVEDLAGRIDFALAFFMVHEVPDAKGFLTDVQRALAPGGKVLVAEPRGHVTAERFQKLLDTAKAAGFAIHPGPKLSRSHTAVLVK